ncbi:MAG: hypothetical protein RL404_822 [Pseudomonadota bacterium]
MPSRIKPDSRTASLADKLPHGSESELFRLVVEAAPNAIIVTNASGEIALVNQQAEKLFRYSRDELLGKRVELLIPERFRQHHPTLRSQFMADPTTRAMGAGRDLYACTKDGEEIPIEIGLNPIHTPDGTLVLSSIIDIRERKAAEERFRHQTEQIAAASRYKSEFLANMSHELRTPLNSILILSEQLKNNVLGNLSQKQVTHADIIHRSGSDLLALINDILDLSKIEAGRMSVLLEPLSLDDFAESVERSFRPMAEAKHLKFMVNVDPDAPPVIVSDHQRIFQIVRNLFSNALKFTSDGSISIRLFGNGKAGARQLGIAVTDTGIGVPEDKHELIFDAFRQVDGSTSRRFGGTGLGLSISRSLAQLLGGSIELASQPGQGSTFTLYLPTGANDRLSLPSPDHIAQGPSTDVLLVEDNQVEARHYARLIGEMGYQVTVASDGRAALQACRRRPFACIVLDLALPDMSGVALIDTLLDEQLVGKANLILNTAHTLTEAELRHMNELRVLVLGKSMDDEHRLLDAVRLRLAAPPALVPASPAFPSNDTASATPFSGKRLLLVDDDIRNIYAMSSLVEELGFDVEVAMNGQQAIDVVEREHTFDIVLMDMMMPIMDGYEATRELKFNRKYERPVIALTAHAMKGDREKCLQAGADDYLAKPVTQADLVDMLAKWMEPQQV